MAALRASLLASVLQSTAADLALPRAFSQAANFAPSDTECPLDSPVEPFGNRIDYIFCGNNFRYILNPTYLQNWRAIQVKSSDIFFATLGPSGSAKNPGMDIIVTLTGSSKISGHTEFPQYNNWEDNPGGPPSFNTTDRRQIGTHVGFEWLPTDALQTPAGQQPCSVVYLVREPKENFVAAALWGGGDAAGVGPFIQTHVNATQNLGRGLLGYPYGGFAAYANAYANGIGGESQGGPKVFLLSQTRLANPNTVSAEVARLAEFLEIQDYVEDPAVLSSLQVDAADKIGDVSLMGGDDAALVDATFMSPAVDPRVVELYAPPSEDDAAQRHAGCVAWAFLALWLATQTS